MRVSYETLDAICPSNEDYLLSKEEQIACLGKVAAEATMHQSDIEFDLSSLHVRAEIRA